MLKVIGFLVVVALVVVGISALVRWVISHNTTPLPPLRELEVHDGGTDYISPVEKLEYGDISDDFATAIRPDVSDEQLEEELAPPKADFVQGGIFTPTEAEKKHLLMVQELEAKRKSPNAKV